MKKQKLLLSWPTKERPQGKVIDAVLSAWTASRVDQILVVMRSDDRPLRRACEAWPVTMLCPETPPEDMKASVQWGVRFFQRHEQATSEDRLFVAPADIPGLSHEVIDGLADSEFSETNIVQPQYGDHLSHPVLFPWSRTREFFALEDEQGISTVVDAQPNVIVTFPAELLPKDVDTPEEYRRALKTLRSEN